MALTRSFRETVQKRVKNDPEFRAHLLKEAMDCFLAGDIDTGKSLLRDYLNATESTDKIAHIINTDVKSIRRMIGPKGNPTTKNLFNIFNACTKNEKIVITTSINQKPSKKRMKENVKATSG